MKLCLRYIFLDALISQTVSITCPIMSMSLGEEGSCKGRSNRGRMKDNQIPWWLNVGPQPPWGSSPPCPAAPSVSSAMKARLRVSQVVFFERILLSATVVFSWLFFITWIFQVATGEPSSLSTTTKPCSYADAGRADPPSKTCPILPDRAYEATAARRTPRTQRVRRASRTDTSSRSWEMSDVL